MFIFFCHLFVYFKTSDLIGWRKPLPPYYYFFFVNILKRLFSSPLGYFFTKLSCESIWACMTNLAAGS